MNEYKQPASVPANQSTTAAGQRGHVPTAPPPRANQRRVTALYRNKQDGRRVRLEARQYGSPRWPLDEWELVPADAPAPAPARTRRTPKPVDTEEHRQLSLWTMEALRATDEYGLIPEADRPGLKTKALLVDAIVKVRAKLNE